MESVVLGIQKRVNQAVASVMELTLLVGWGREDNLQVDNGEKCYKGDKLGFVMEGNGEG